MTESEHFLSSLQRDTHERLLSLNFHSTHLKVTSLSRLLSRSVNEPQYFFTVTPFVLTFQ